MSNSIKSIFQASVNGRTFGNYYADDIEEAREIFAKDAGYSDWQSMASQYATNNVEITEVADLDCPEGADH